MIVVVIIVLLTQLGNVGGLFRSRERNKVEEIAVKIIAAIDEEKVNALLGKTLDGKIVRKRLVTLDFVNNGNTIDLTSEVNLAEEPETVYDTPSKITKSWTLTGLETEVHECGAASPELGIQNLAIEFRDDKILFIDNPTVTLPHHIVLLLKHTNTAHEIHIDRRTGLTYETESPGKKEDGSWQITCN